MIFRDLKGLQSTLHMDRLLEMLDEVHFVEFAKHEWAIDDM